MHAQLHKRNDLQSSKNRLRAHDQDDGASSQEPPMLADKGKGQSYPKIQRKKDSLYLSCHKPKFHKEEKSPPPPKPVHEKRKELMKVNSTKRGHVVFNIENELEKVKISVPLSELLKQPTYRAQASQFMFPSAPDQSPDNLNLQK